MSDSDKAKSIRDWEAFAARCAEPPVELPAPKVTVAKPTKGKKK